MPAPKPPAKAGGNVLTRKIGPLPTWAWAAIAVGGYLVWRQRKAAQAAANSSTTSTAPSSPLAGVPTGYGYQGPGFGAGGGGPIPTGATAATNAGDGSGVTTTTIPSSVPSPTSPGGQINIGGQLYDILGQVSGSGPGSYNFSGYNVGGGAPVFYGNATSGVEQGTVKSGYAYTPAGNESLIAPTAVSGEKIG